MVLVAGSANLDFVVRAQHIPAPGETVMGHSVQSFAGGKGANQAVASARAGGVRTEMVLALGTDSHAEFLKTSLQSAGVALHIHVCADQTSGTAFICVADNAENAITVAPGANDSLQARHLPPLAGFSHLLMQLETPLDTVAACARAAKAAGMSVVLNAAPARTLSPDLLALVDILIVNEGELRSLSPGASSISQAMQALPCEAVVVTLGPQGSAARFGTHWFFQPGFAVDAVDTTGAGDTFCGMLVAQLSLGAGPAQALQLANAAAGLACTAMGAQASVPTRAAVAAFMQSQGPANTDGEHRLRDACQQATA